MNLPAFSFRANRRVGADRLGRVNKGGVQYMQFNSTTGYAIQMMIYLAKNMRRIVPSVELSEYITVSQRYLLQIAGKLRDGGFIGVNRGMAGGYHLLQDPSQLNIYDVYNTYGGQSSHSRKHWIYSGRK